MISLVRTLSIGMSDIIEQFSAEGDETVRDKLRHKQIDSKNSKYAIFNNL